METKYPYTRREKPAGASTRRTASVFRISRTSHKLAIAASPTTNAMMKTLLNAAGLYERTIYATRGPTMAPSVSIARVVAERTAHLFLGRRERDQGIPRRVAQAFADTIRKPQTDDGPHASREHIKGSRENRESVAYDGEYLALLYPVRPAAGIDFYEIGRGLRNAFHEAQRFRTGFQYRYKERRKYRRNHLRGEIVEEAGQPQEENIAR